MLRAIPQAPMITAFRSQAFAWLWTGQTISLLGNAVFRIALAWQVLLLTHSAFAMSLVAIASLLPTIAFALLGGAVADRFPRRVILFCSDSGRALVVGGVALLALLHLLQLWHLVILSLLFGFVDGFFTPAYQALQPQVVAQENLQGANALTQFGVQTTRLLGPVVGAWCIAVTGAASAFAVDSLSFFLAAIATVVMHIPTAPSAEAGELPSTTVPLLEEEKELPGTQTALAVHASVSLVTTIREGIAYVISLPWLWMSIIFFAVLNIVYFAPLGIALPKLVYDVYGAGAWLLGLLGAAEAIPTGCATRWLFGVNRQFLP